MIIVNITNANQAYIFLSSLFLGLDIQQIVLIVALAGFVVSFVLSIIFLTRENGTEHRVPIHPSPRQVEPTKQTEPPRPFPTVNRTVAPSSQSDAGNIRTLKQALVNAFSAQENVGTMVSSLEELRLKNIIDDEVYERNKNDYEAMIRDASSAIISLREKINGELDSKKKILADLQNRLQAPENDIMLNSTGKTPYHNAARNLKNESDRLNREIANLQVLSEARGSYDLADFRD
jgi:hypothetical protein